MSFYAESWLLVHYLTRATPEGARLRCVFQKLEGERGRRGGEVVGAARAARPEAGDHVDPGHVQLPPVLARDGLQDLDLDARRPRDLEFALHRHHIEGAQHHSMGIDAFRHFHDALVQGRGPTDRAR